MKAFQRGVLVASIAVAVSVVVKVRSKGPVPPASAADGASCRAPTSGERPRVKTVLVVGLGEVGIRAARQLIDTPGIDRVIVAARRLEHAREVAGALHDGAEPYQLGRDDPFPDGLDAVVAALPGEADASLARRAVGAGIPLRVGGRP